MAIQSAQPDEETLIDAIKRHDELAFVELVGRYQAPLLRLALVYARSRAVAEEVVQDTWLGVLQGIDRFERRSSFKTWLFRILVNRARTRAEREGRMIPFAAHPGIFHETAEEAVPSERFLGPDHPEWPYHWAVAPRAWSDSAEEQLLARETLELVNRAIAALPPAQREVITLATCRVGRQRRCVTFWRLPRLINVCCCTGREAAVRGELERYFDLR